MTMVAIVCIFNVVWWLFYLLIVFGVSRFIAGKTDNEFLLCVAIFGLVAMFLNLYLIRILGKAGMFLL